MLRSEGVGDLGWLPSLETLLICVAYDLFIEVFCILGRVEGYIMLRGLEAYVCNSFLLTE